jgi:hypothetical protein
MNKVKTFITGLLFMLLVVSVAAIHAGIRLQKDLSDDYNKIYTSIRLVQTTMVTEASLAEAAKNIVSPVGAINSVDLLVNDTGTINKITPKDLIKNTLLQRTFRSSIDTGASALNDLQVAANRFPKMKKDPAIKELLGNLESTVNQSQAVRNGTMDLIKSYNAKFNSIPTIMIASIIGYNKLPVYIM